MFGLVLKRTHRRALQQWGEEEHASRDREAGLHKLLVEKDGQLREQDALINSTERMQVLGDLEEALNLMQAYQRVLSMMSLSDPNIIKANALLEKYGKKGDPNATYLGAQTRGKSTSQDLLGKIPDSYDAFAHHASAEIPTSKGDEFVFDPASPKTRQEQEEEYWGEEAYGSAHIRIEAEAIDEGGKKEPGYTRASVRFVDLNAEEPPVLTAAKATTEGAHEET